jgi:ribonuclease BN (tRNA processing enzyme)
VVKCTYCRSEFQQTSKGNTTTICKKCEYNVKQHGKPSACDYCNTLAAFVGSKCQRCVNAEKKYGPPVTCEQCKQKCAFDRKDEDKKVDGKLLCWLCTLSFKRALAKTKSTDPARHSHVKLGSSNKPKEPKKPHDKRPQRVDVTKMNEEAPPPPKQPRQGSRSEDIAMGSDHLVAMTQLREQISNLHRQIAQKDKDLLAKDRQITELRAANFTTENECREKLKQHQREYESKSQALQNKLKALQKEVAQLSKAKNKSSLTIIRGGEPPAAPGSLQATLNKLNRERHNDSSDDSG